MKKIIGSFVFTVVTVLCVAILVCGIVSVKDETSYIISGERENIISAQYSDTQQLLLKSDEDNKKTLTLTDEHLRKIKFVFEVILPSPLGNILWAVD